MTMFLASLLGLALWAQDIESTNRFAVASIRLNTDGYGVVSYRTTPDGISYENVSLFKLIEGAFDFEDFQLHGGPSWIKTDTFDIVAKASEGTVLSPAQRAAMVRNLVIDRFKLAFKREVRQMPVFLLTTRKPGVFGPHLSASDVDCTLPDTPVTVRRDPQRCYLEYGFETIIARGMPLDTITSSVQSDPAIQRIIIDRTGLTGPFNFSLHYNRGDKRDSLTPSIFTALEEQLNLKLESASGPVDTMTIESAERPTND